MLKLRLTFAFVPFVNIIVPDTQDGEGYTGFRVVMGMGQSASQEQ